MKSQFESYEQESEKYYADMLDKFKLQAKEVCLRKEKELESLQTFIQAKEAKVMRIKSRIVGRGLKGLQSDVEESSEDEAKPLKLDMIEYNFKKAERDKYKLVVEQWVRNFKEVNRRAPKD